MSPFSFRRQQSRAGGWCCLGFQGHCEVVGERGTAIFTALDYAGDYQFFFQHRAIEQDWTIPVTDFPVSTVTDTVIQYCPWCGANLADFYRGRMEALDRSDLRVRIN